MKKDKDMPEAGSQAVGGRGKTGWWLKRKSATLNVKFDYKPGVVDRIPALRGLRRIANSRPA